MAQADEERRLVVMLSTAVFLEREQVEPVLFVEPGRQWSGWHVNPEVWAGILLGAAHWHPENP